MKMKALVCLALLLAAAGCGGDDDGTVNTSGSFLALTYNVAGLPEGLSSSHPSIYTQLISPRLNAYDLVLVQESWEEPVPNTLPPDLHVYHQILAADAHHPYKSVPAPLPLGKDPTRPLAVVSDGLNRFSNFPFEPVIRQRWAECDNSAADCLSQKGFSVARTEFAPGVVIDVYNLHMEAGGTPHDDQLKMDDVVQIATFMSEFSAGRAVIVGGDFNLHGDREPDATTIQSLLDAEDLTDVCTALACPQPGRIDKFLFRSSDEITIAPLSWSNEDAKFRADDGEPLSDHEPVAVRFEWTVG